MTRAFAPILMGGVAVFHASIAHSENWAPFNSCLERYVGDVDIAEPSIHGGAELIVNVLCLEQASDLANEMLGTRQAVVEQNGWGGAFQAFLRVMEREAKLALFQQRMMRLSR